MFGYLRVAAGVPKVKVADVGYNVTQICCMIDDAESKGVALLSFPELSVTGYTCADLFGSARLVNGAEEGLKTILAQTRGKSVTVVVGVPVPYAGRLYNCAAVVRNGCLKGLVPKIYMPQYGEFYEGRWFASGADFLRSDSTAAQPALDNAKALYREGFGAVTAYAGQKCNISPNLLFEIGNVTFAVEICEDLWTPLPPSAYHSVAGAQVTVNLSASNEVLLKHSYRKSLVCEQSAHTHSVYVYCSCGYGESTQDLVFAGSSMIAENGAMLAEAERFSLESSMIIADADIEKLEVLRRKQSTFTYFTPDGRKAGDYAGNFAHVNVGALPATDFESAFYRSVEPHPFVPAGNPSEIDSRCREIISIQVMGLVTRLARINAKSAVIGISGGLDSTLALIVTAMAFDRLGWDRKRIVGVTMPGLGTTVRTRTNADDLMESLGITCRTVSVVPAVDQHFKDIGHDPSVMDTTYENSQARERTQILMDISNQTGGIVVGTGDLSELALGWCTYNGDHMSMYGVNAGVPKTLVRSLCKWAADNVFNASVTSGRTVSDILYDIIDTPISPELKPADSQGNITQLTEDLVGPYELHDFFLYHFFRFGSSPEKILFLAGKAFAGKYDESEIKHWLSVFVKRFFGQQFKRSCLPDGPKVGSVSLSPRGDWRMPSDAWATLFEL